MKRRILQGGITSLLILSFLATPVAVPFSAYALTGDEDFGPVNPEPNPYTVGAIGGVSSCLAVDLLITGAGQQERAKQLLTSPWVLASVPVYDPTVHLAVTTRVAKEGILKCIAGALAKAVIRELTKSTINWINSGFQGKPVFVQDFGKFLTNIADQQVGEFIYGSSALAGLCSAFGLQVRITIARSRIADRPVQCTLSGVIKNVEGFFKNFQNGGWGAWLSLTTVTTNNPYGAYFYYQIALDNQILAKQAIEGAKVNQGGGFLSIEVCRSRSARGTCLRSDVISPGSLISTQLNKALGNQWDVLNVSQDIASIIDALMVALLQKVFTSNTGLAGLGSVYASSGGSTFSSGSFSDAVDAVQDEETRKIADTIVAQIESAIRFEQRVIDIKAQTRSEIEVAQDRLNDLGNCYSEKLGSGSGALTSEQRTFAEHNKSNAWLAAQALTPRINEIFSAEATSTATIAVLENFRTRALSSKNQAEATAVLTDFYQTRALGTFSSEFATIEAQRELESTRTEMQELNRSTDEKLNQCYAFPGVV